MIKMKFFYTYLLILFIIVPGKSFSGPHSFRAWSNILYNSHFTSNPDLLYGFLLEGRFDDQPGLFYQALIQAQLGYKASDTTQVWLGYTLIPNTEVQPAGRITHLTERLYQQLITRLLENPHYELLSRSRMEERHRIGEDELGLIYRQLFTLNLPSLTLRNKYTPFLSNELFININKPIWSNQKHFNQNRLMLGWTFPCGEHKCQLAYLNQFLVARANKEVNSIVFFSLIL